jgi:polyhydroxybutyrate depolymerase
MKMLRPLAALTLIATASLALAGCGALRDNHAATGAEVRTLTVDGVDRSYRLYAPDELADDPSLVVMMHGGLGSARQAEDAYGWNAEADSGGFIVAYPDGIRRVWNAGDCCGRSTADDVGFITALVDDLQAEFDVSPARTFATGMSNGAMMSYTLACDSDLFAAIAPVAGTIVTACDSPSPVSVLHIHGLDDGKVRMDGERGEGPGDVDGLPIADVNALWRGVDTCAEPDVVEQGLVTTSTSDCADGRRVVLVTVADAGHQWPGSVAREGASDQPVDTLDATALIWEFFDAA